MTHQLSSPPETDFLSTLETAVTPGTSRPAAKAVVYALLQAEKAAKQQHLSYPANSLLGDWRLYFTTSGAANLKQGIAVGKGGFYVPKWVGAQISFHPVAETQPHELEIANQVKVGLGLLRLVGQARYLEQKNLLAFDFTQIQVKILGKILYQGQFSSRRNSTQPFAERSISQLPFFTFFWITENSIAARGRGGGLAIWVRASESAN
ncbi:hypothetical protein H6G20_22235 [Desertifilum sp. FACHB-1129]|uniref:Plastid lipid-associated protein/fibrillin conserved domain-containing protein n=2 Tax=Desertifilum tharense IPPAS B-1220 TaxID=1781255 RepID=A0A1E5QI15_9CYAN|nr:MULTISPECIES: hypothetical protein [Desertifilum]MDA0212031.1 hypothetical protein [Cyanobacteria bacterium FC1]MBD2314394.1 hypothetical protein [Desertifilum sp. FACHB-1129]MBD2324911.1 hypothetical protein [Desertifilum sp. FACHB-866]MBD2335004.1 hypothetical protein [Desertifilum sp. FACHB-868]OEJ74336.1 hypothetical protein BH720_15290 [Desertifilum tharense IPPAS B-1220]